MKLYCTFLNSDQAYSVTRASHESITDLRDKIISLLDQLEQIGKKQRKECRYEDMVISSEGAVVYEKEGQKKGSKEKPKHNGKEKEKGEKEKKKEPEGPESVIVVRVFRTEFTFYCVPYTPQLKAAIDSGNAPSKKTTVLRYSFDLSDFLIEDCRAVIIRALDMIRQALEIGIEA